MYIEAKMYIEGKVFTILSSTNHMSQATDSVGKVSAIPLVGIYDIEIVDTGEGMFFAWMSSYMMMKEVVLKYIDPHKKSKTIKLLDTVCVGYSSRFTDSGGSILSLRLSAAIVIEDGITMFVKHWRVSDPDAVVAEPTSIEEEEPVFLGYYFEDKDGKQIEQSKLKYNQKFYLIIETENSEGETVTINLDDDRLDFKYNGQVAENDTLKGITIIGDKTKIKLTAIKQ